MEKRFILRLAEIDDIPSIMEIEQICFDKDSFSKRQFVYLSRISVKGGGLF